MNIPTSRQAITLATFLLLSLSCVSCNVRTREDVRTIDYSVPTLAGPECSKALLQVLSRTDGIVDAIPDTTTRSISVKYNSRVTAQKNIEHAIAAAGFDVGDTPADPEAKAKLPAPCR